VTTKGRAPVLEGLDRAALLGTVRQALGDATANIDAWEVKRVGAIELNPVIGGLLRLGGIASGTGMPATARPWSVVLKVARAPEEGTVHLGGHCRAGEVAPPPTEITGGGRRWRISRVSWLIWLVVRRCGRVE
jgi:hypothetical protein